MSHSPPVVLLHGAGGNAATWSPTLSTWGADDVRALDLPGRGVGCRAPARSAEEAAARLAPDLGALPEPPLVVGHSYGGAVALSLALNHPECVAGIALVASGARLRVAPHILDAVARCTDDGPFRLDFAFGPATPAAVIERYAAAAQATPAAATLADWRACDGFDVRDRLGEITRPVLVVHGALDPLTPPHHQQRMTAALRCVRRVELPGVGHMLPWEAPAALVAAVRHGWSDLERDADVRSTPSVA